MYREADSEVPRPSVLRLRCPVLGLESRSLIFVKIAMSLMVTSVPSCSVFLGVENKALIYRPWKPFIFLEVVFASSVSLPISGGSGRKFTWWFCLLFLNLVAFSRPFLVFHQQALVAYLLVQNTLGGAGVQRPTGVLPTYQKWVVELPTSRKVARPALHSPCSPPPLPAYPPHTFPLTSCTIQVMNIKKKKRERLSSKHWLCAKPYV